MFIYALCTEIHGTFKWVEKDHSDPFLGHYFQDCGVKNGYIDEKNQNVRSCLQNITKDEAFSNRPTGPNQAECKKKYKNTYIYIYKIHGARNKRRGFMRCYLSWNVCLGAF